MRCALALKKILLLGGSERQRKCSVVETTLDVPERGDIKSRSGKLPLDVDVSFAQKKGAAKGIAVN